MKTIIRAMWTVARNMRTDAKRKALHVQMRYLESHIDGCDESLACVRDPLLIARIKVSRSISCRELAKVRAAYNATFRPGVRNVWRTA